MVTRLSDPETVLRKLNQLYDRIEAFYETVDLVQALKHRLEAACDRADDREKDVLASLANFDDLAGHYRAAVNALGTIAARSEAELARMLGEFEAEKKRLNDAFRIFEAENRKLEDRQCEIERRTDAGLERLAEQMARAAETVHSETKAQQRLLARARDEDRAAVQQEMARLKIQFDQSREEIEHLEDRLADFQSSLAARLNHRIDVQVNRQNAYEESTTCAVDNRFAEEQDALTAKAETEFERLRSLFQKERARVDEALAFLQDERTRVDERHAFIDAEMSRIQKQMDVLSAAASRKVDRSVDESNAVIARQVAHVEAFIADSDESARRVQNELKEFRNRLSENMDREVEALIQRQAAFQQNTAQELFTRLSAESKSLKAKVETEIETLAGERKAIEEMGQGLEESLRSVNRKIQSKTHYFTSQLNNLIRSAQHDITGIGDIATGRMQERMDAFDAFSTNARTRMTAMRDAVQAFVNQLREKAEKDAEKLLNRQAAFQSDAIKKITARMNAESRRLADAWEKTVTERLAAAESRQADLVADTAERLRRMEEDVATLRAADETTAGHLDTMARTHGSRLETLEARIAALEAACKEMQDRKLLGRFPLKLGVKKTEE